MGNDEYYQAKLDVLKAMEDCQVRKPHHIPVRAYIQEADNLYHWTQDDRVALTGAGLDWEVVEDLPARIGTLVTAEAHFQSRRLPWADAQQELNSRYTEAEELKKNVLKGFRFAFQKHPQLLKTVRESSKGESRAALVQSLNDLSVLGRANVPLLEVIHFDMPLVERAAEMSAELSKLVAEAAKERMKPNDAADIRNRAYSHLKEAVDLIRGFGKFVFSEDKERRKGYISNYMRRLELKRARISKEKSKKKGEKKEEEKAGSDAEAAKSVLHLPLALKMETVLDSKTTLRDSKG